MTACHDSYLLLQNTILNQEPSIEPYLHLPPQGSIADRIAIYANGFHSRFKKVLASDYKILAAVIEDNNFTELCRQYVTAYPSSHYSLSVMGQHLSRFLTDVPPYSQIPYLAEIAAYEWAELDAFTAADKILLTAHELQSLPAEQWSQMIFHLHPSCHVLQMNWTTCTWINALRSNDKRSLLPEKLNDPESIMIWRYKRQVRYSLLNDLECLVIDAIKTKASFLDICERLNSYIPEQDVVNYLVKTLYGWLTKEWFIH